MCAANCRNVVNCDVYAESVRGRSAIASDCCTNGMIFATAFGPANISYTPIKAKHSIPHITPHIIAIH